MAISMYKKHLSIIASLLLIPILIAGCDTGRNLSTPETRIVGHWGLGRSLLEGQDDWENLDSCYEVYIGELDEDSVGSYFTVNPGYTTSMEPSGECEIDYDQYRVITNEYPEEILEEMSELSESSEYGDLVIIRFVSLEEGDESIVGWGVPVLISEDGQTLTLVSLQGPLQYQYIDSKTEP